MERVRIEIGGRSCANCASTISDAVADLDGVEDVDANYATDEGTVTFDPDLVSLSEIYEAIERAGYEPIAQTITVAITDMTCATCSVTVEDAVGELPGVLSVDANFATDEAQVRYNPTATDRAAVADAIERAGHTPVQEDEGADQDVRETARNAETRRQRLARRQRPTRQTER